MEKNKRRIYRWIAIGVSIAGLLITVALYIIQHEWNLLIQISLGLFIIGLAVYVVLDPDTIRRVITGRQARYGSNAVILAVAFVGILVVFNYLAYKNNKQWDLTANQSNTLAKETTNVLKKLTNTVVAKAFFTSSSAMATSKADAKTLLDKYSYAGGGKFKYEFIDPNTNPTAAKNAGITTDGSIVLYLGDQKQAAASATEGEITGAIIRLMNPGAHVVYFLTGHGEYPIDTSTDQSYTTLKTTLESRNYKVSSLNLLTTNQIPPDAGVIVIAGPQKPLSDGEVSLLDAYLKNGGSAVIMEEPTLVTSIGNSPDPLADYLSKTYGITLDNDIVVDLTGYRIYQSYYLAIGAPSGSHPIINPISNLIVGFNNARSVSTNATVGSDFTKTKLEFTAAQSWGETDLVALQSGAAPSKDPNVDISGPVPLAVAAQGGSKDTRLVVMGDSEFATNAGYSFYGNGDLIVNSIDWAAKVENLISLTSATSVTRTLVQPKAYTQSLILFGSMVILPGIVLAAGIGTWIARRRQG